MKRNILYLLLLAILAMAVYYFVVKQQNSTLAEDEMNFAVEDTAAVGKILIADMNGKKIALARKQDGWWVNDKYPARKDAVELLLSTIRNIRIKFPVAEAANDNVVKELATQNKKVDIFDRNGNLLQSYFVGGSTADGTANYMKTEKGEHPFAVGIPGFAGTVSIRYIVNENEMRSRDIFNTPLNRIKSVKVEYPMKPDSSFMLTVWGIDSFTVTRLKDNSVFDHRSVNKDRVGTYLSMFRFINAEAYDNDNKGKDTILIQKPFCIISLTNRNEEVKTATCYYKPVTVTTKQQYDQHGNPMNYDSDHYYATINEGKDFVLIQQFHFGQLFKAVSFFLKAPLSKKRVR